MDDLNFDGHNTQYATHGLHSYAAKCPPQLARFGIENYSQPGSTVLDPMAGSGTTLVEARLLGRNAIGYDIDPLACLISQVKCQVLSDISIEIAYNAIVEKTKQDLNKLDASKKIQESSNPIILPEFLNRDYWFSPNVSTSLAILSSNIDSANIPGNLRDFFWVAFSSIILTKVSVANARDIIHSRHHFFKHISPPDVISKFSERVRRMRRQMLEFGALCQDLPQVGINVKQADARNLPLDDHSVDLVFTSPPYATALDYPRAHFLAVGWMQKRLGLDIEQYKKNGTTYIGSERGRTGNKFTLAETISAFPLTQQTLLKLAESNARQANLIQRYFIDMKDVFGEINRVLKVGSYAIIVVCPSHIRKVEIQTHKLFTEIAGKSGLVLKEEHTRTINGNKRILPYMQESFGDRMSTEYVLIYQKGE
jgi:DNA modification methylase